MTQRTSTPPGPTERREFRSRIGVLYQQARNTVRTRGERTVTNRIEDFLTELLSIAILADDRPIRRLMRDHHLLESSRRVEGIRPYTQQQVVSGDTLFDRARLDLVLALDGPVESEVWVEVKAGSGFTGDQLDRYRRAIDEAADRLERKLVVLAPGGTRLPSGDDSITLVTWDDLVEAIRGSEPASALWRDLADFLTEAPGDLVREARPAVAPRSEALLVELLTVAIEAPIGWWRWRGVDGSARRHTLATAVRRDRLDAERRGERPPAPPRLRLWSPWQLVYLEVALETPARLVVRLSLAHRYGIPYEALWRRARDSGLSDRGWSIAPRRELDPVLEIGLDLDGSETPDQLGAWVRERIRELQGDGCLPNLDGNGRERGPNERAPTRAESKVLLDAGRGASG